MEPTDLNPKPSDDALDAWLRANSSQPVLPDDGFSQRVLAALPARASRRLNRTVCSVAGLAAGIALVAIGTVASGGLPPDLAALDAQLTRAIVQLLSPPAVAAMGVALLSLWYAFRDRWRLLPRL